MTAKYDAVSVLDRMTQRDAGCKGRALDEVHQQRLTACGS
jgi:hypothetical protein